LKVPNVLVCHNCINCADAYSDRHTSRIVIWFADAKSERTQERMKLFLEAKNGFELAEYDLQLRGTGELTGTQQWGISDIGMEALRNLKLVEAARQAAHYAHC